MFSTFDDLKPMQTVLERSLQNLGQTLQEHFPAYDSSGAIIADRPMAKSFDHFPMKIHFSYLPRLHGAQKIQGVHEVLFEVMRKDET